MALLDFNRLFPTPKYLLPPVAGLDISDQSIKFIELRRRRRFEVVKYGDQSIPAGIIESGAVRDEKGLVDVLKQLKNEHGLSDVVASLPEEEAFVVQLTLPADLHPSEIRGALELQLEEHVPLPISEAVFDYEILSGPIKGRVNGYEVGVSVFPKKIAGAYSEALANAGLRPLALEIEAQAIARSVVPAGDERLVMIVDFGKTRISFFIVSGSAILFTTTAEQIGGDDLTKAIQKGLNLSHEEAEEVKINEGLLVGRRRRDLFFSLLPIVSVLRDEIIKHCGWWNSRRGGSGVFDRPIEQVVVCGGQATLPGLIDYLRLNLDWPVELGNPWSNIFSFEEQIPPINLNQAQRYATSLGLALRGLISGK